MILSIKPKHVPVWRAARGTWEIGISKMHRRVTDKARFGCSQPARRMRSRARASPLSRARSVVELSIFVFRVTIVRIGTGTTPSSPGLIVT